MIGQQHTKQIFNFLFFFLYMIGQQHTKQIFNFLFFFLYNLKVFYFNCKIVNYVDSSDLRSIVLLDVALSYYYYYLINFRNASHRHVQTKHVQPQDGQRVLVILKS